MLELPSEDANFATWSTRVVRDDYHFVVDGVRYSAPWRCLSDEEVRVSWTDGVGALVPQRRAGCPGTRHDRDAGTVYSDRSRAVRPPRASLVRKRDG